MNGFWVSSRWVAMMCAVVVTACGDVGDDPARFSVVAETVDRRIEAAGGGAVADVDAAVMPLAGAIRFDDVTEDESLSEYQSEQAFGLTVDARSSQPGLIRPRDLSSAPTPSIIDLGSASTAERAVMNTLPSGKSSDEQRRPVASGFGRKVPEDQAQQASEQMQWREQAQQRQAAAVGVRSTGARSTRLGVRFERLPRDARVRFYASGATTMVDYPAAHVLRVVENNRAAGLSDRLATVFWGPVIDSETAVVEVLLPSGTSASDADFTMVQVVQLERSSSTAGTVTGRTSREPGVSAYCQENAVCDPAATGNEAADATLLLDFVEYDAFGFAMPYVCTGTLITDSGRTGAAYLLTANHCIGNQATAQTVEARQFYRSTSCLDSSQRDAREQVLPGFINYLYSEKRSTGTDVSMLSLAYHGPVGMSLAGWSAATVSAATAVKLFHHPEGDLLKRSEGTARPKNTNYLSVIWSRGVTEGGSSGSALLNPSRQVIGTLWGGSSYCITPELPDDFGRFSGAYARGLRKWLYTPGYQIGGVGDIDGDGRKDLLWYQKTTSVVQTIVSRHQATNSAEVTGWINPHVEGDDSYHAETPYLVAVRDLTGDGKDDLIYRFPSALQTDRYDLAVRYRDAGGEWHYDWLHQNLASTVRVLGYADMDGNGVRDLVLYNSKSMASISGSQNEVVIINLGIDGDRLVPVDNNSYWMYAAERPVAVGNFAGDATAEILWRNVNYPKDAILSDQQGYVNTWVGALGSSPGTLIGADDFNADGHTDLIFNNAGLVQIRFSQPGSVPLFQPPVKAIASVPLGFRLVAVGDLDGDGRADTVWRLGGDVRVARSVTLPVTWQKLSLQ